MLFDGGGAVYPQDTDPGREIVTPFLRSRGIHTIDVMVVSHTDADHLNGLLYVAQNFRVRELWHSAAGVESPRAQRLLQFVQGGGGSIRTIATLPKTQQRQGVSIELLHPRPQGDVYYDEWSLNDNSVVMRLSLGKRSFVFPGDIGRDAEEIVAATLQTTDGFKAPHHGSSTSSSTMLLDTLDAKFVIISCGADNGFSFPHADVLRRYDDYHLRVIRTDVEGMVSMHTDGRTWQIESHRGESLQWPQL
ncbi:MAG: MBL fold metallo-hydrolase [Myxococcota bacterium]